MRQIAFLKLLCAIPCTHTWLKKKKKKRRRAKLFYLTVLFILKRLSVWSHRVEAERFVTAHKLRRLGACTHTPTQRGMKIERKWATDMETTSARWNHEERKSDTLFFRRRRRRREEEVRCMSNFESNRLWLRLWVRVVFCSSCCSLLLLAVESAWK